MKFSKTFKIYHNHITDENLIFIEEFHKYLTKEGESVLRRNLYRALRGSNGEKKYHLGEECATVEAVLRYICIHSAQTACRKLLKTVEKEIIGQTESERVKTSTLELYRLIAKTHINRTGLLFNNLNINENSINTLIVHYKPYFSDIEWKRICCFENDFSTFQECGQLSYEEIISLKCARFQSLLSLQECCKILFDSSQRQIRKNFHRFQLSDKQKQVRLRANQTHIASIVDNDIKSIIDLYCPNSVENTVCFDVTSSPTSNVLWAVFIQNDTLETLFSDLCKRVFYSLKRRHNVYLEKVLLLDSEAASGFLCADGSTLRFCLRDAIETGKIRNTIGTWSAETLIDGTIDDHRDDGKLCHWCFNEETNNKPLHKNSFNIVDEWFLELPVEIQIVLEQFLNQNSITKARSPEDFLKTKLEKLYLVYDILLNTINKNYFGLFQRNNANKLLIEYKSIGSVFDVTASTGTTPGLRFAEEILKNEANVDLCYYNTYLKDHELTYKTTDDSTMVCVNLRKCHLILMLDNLVRLQYITDPNPGEHRSKQLCTLPITLQGLPIDSKVTDEWHLPDCNGTYNCVCKYPVTLSDNEMLQTLTDLSVEEQETHTQFSKWMTFGNHLVWKRIPDDLLQQVEDNGTDQIDMQDIFDMEDCVAPDDEKSGTIQADNDTARQAEDDTDCQDEDLMDVLNTIQCDTEEEQLDYSFSDDEDDELKNIEKSMDEMSILEQDFSDDSPNTVQDRLKDFGFEKFIVPPLLCRHPPPATGRDDDVEKIREILDDVLIKSGYEANTEKRLHRILCGPDNKIGKCLFQLMDRDNKYKVFLPEFPLLHLRKSKINILLSAYKNAGLLEIIQVMRNDDKNDWGNLISIQHIDIASKHIRRLAIAFNLAFLIYFAQNLEKNEMQEFLSDMEADECATTADKWSQKFKGFLSYGCEKNATFAMHVDMMLHCNDIVAIMFSERIGGSTGYDLLLGAVKKSLLFSFVNGATSYAPYCVKLLRSHYTAGHFHKCLKTALYTTPFKASSKNFATDTKREMDHQEVVRGFRSGSSIYSVTCRMSLIDSLNEASHSKMKETDIQVEDKLGMDISDTDMNHIYPATSLILRRGGLSLEESSTPLNVYSKTPVKLPLAIIDSASEGVGKYLIQRFLLKEKVLQDAVIPTTDIQGPKDLVSRARRSKGITIKRVQKSNFIPLKTERQMREAVRLKNVAKESKLIDAMSSENNACQALLKPDSSKPKVAKAVCIPRALKNLVASCSPKDPMEHFISLNLPYVPKSITQSTALITLEFAGTKFKMKNIKSGQEYIQEVERILTSIMNAYAADQIVICEEKYSFTPDDFKASTREQRKVQVESESSHLKTSERVLGDLVYDNDYITKTAEGKKLISTYLAKNIKKLRLNRNIDIIVDSELISNTHCACADKCNCKIAYAIPIQCRFSPDKEPEVFHLENVKQSKGEAEMAVGDWLIHMQDKLPPEQNIVCYVTSGDIDTLYIHLYALSERAKRNEDGTFKNDVYVVLQKAGGKYDVYHVTAMLNLLENKYHDRHIGMKIAFSLCMGGNDFIPKFYGISHDTILKEVLGNIDFRSNLFISNGSKITINQQVFQEMVKTLYTPKHLRGKQLSYEDVRAISINKKNDDKQKSGFKTTHPRKWLPPSTAIERLCILLDFQVQYIETVGIHNSVLPSFIESDVLARNSSGEIEYDFGPDSHFDFFHDLPSLLPTKRASKRTLDNTPQHGARRKRPLMTSTPRHTNAPQQK